MYICIRAQGQWPPRPPLPQGVRSDFQDAPPPSTGQRCMCICIHKLLRMHLYTCAPISICMHMYRYVYMSAYACTGYHGICMSTHPYVRICMHMHTYSQFVKGHVCISMRMYAYAYMFFYAYIPMRHVYASACIYHHLPAPTTTGGVRGTLKMSTPPLGEGRGEPGGPEHIFIYIPITPPKVG